jgi:DNA primase
MPDPTIEAIKQKIDVKDFVGGYVTLKPAGRNLKGLCPFHKEKSPSFMVTPERQIWHCFGCGKGGDIFAFLMQYENIEFIEALKILAERAGVELKRVGTSDQKKYETVYEINRIAKDYFRSSLQEPAGSVALKYLRERGLTDATIEEFELGVALPGNDALMRHLVKLGYHPDTIKEAGLISKNERGLYYDFFRNRIMFPLHNHFGKVVGFTGRVMPGNDNPDIGKYVNSHDSPIFNKSKLLYGFWKTKNAVRDVSQAVLVEGQMDFLMTYQDGVKNVVATSGTALTADHVQLVRRLAENLVLSFDNDNAGRAAAERTIDLAQANDLNTKVIVFDAAAGNAKDPADVAKEKPGYFAELIKKAVPAMEYYFSYYGIDRVGDIALKKKAIRSALTKIKGIASPVEREHWMQLLSSRTRIPEAALTAEMVSLKVEATVGATVDPKVVAAYVEQPQTRLERIIRRILSIALADKAVLQRALDARKEFPAQYQQILEYCAHRENGTEIGDTAIDAELIGLVNLIYLESGIEPGNGEVDALFAQLKKVSLADRRRELQSKIEQAEVAQDGETLTKLLEEYKALSAQ